MSRFILPGLLLLFLWNCKTKNVESSVLYQSKNFTVFADSVRQGDYSAVAVSDSELVSGYQNPANETFSRLVVFKFSLNGHDNEATPGADHRLLVYPKNGRAVSPIYVFGQADTSRVSEPENDFLEPNTQLTLRVDLSPVLEAWREQGYFTTYNGEKITKDDFKGVYVAGSVEPLNWDFPSLVSRPEAQMKDPDGDGIYEITLTINPYQPKAGTTRRWTLSKDLTGLPRYQSPQKLVNALYNLSLEEMLQDIRPDSTFMAGAQWEGVWTRDISYSIVLSLAAVKPDVARNSLLRKVKKKADGSEVIIQDTGSGGAWPVSTDRTTWALAAWEVYKVTGDRDWLAHAYRIIRQTVADDEKTIVSPETGLRRGESSFLDWREQTYPTWMEPVDIYVSENLGTNAVHYQTYQILTQMASLLGESTGLYPQKAKAIQEAINEHLWQEDKGYYGQYLYGKHHLSLSPRAEALGEALCVLFGVTPPERQASIIAQTPVLEYGIPCIYPQIPAIPPYHNEAIWPFVQAYWTWAAARAGNATAVNQSMGALYRQAALFVNNKENFVARTGDYKGTAINSDRQLWSVAGNLSMVYRILFGMQFEPDHLSFWPFVPAAYSGTKTLRGFHYRQAVLNISLEGHGNGIQSVTLDGKAIPEANIPASLTGEHELRIVLNNAALPESSINLVDNYVSPGTPKVQRTKQELLWPKVAHAAKYVVYKNGKADTTTTETRFRIGQDDKYAEYQVMAVDSQGYESFKSAPIGFVNRALVKIIRAQKFSGKPAGRRAAAATPSYVEISPASAEVTIKVPVVLSGTYLADFRYANGSGPINTDNKCAIRTLLLNSKRVGAVVFPQRGTDQWDNWGYSNSYLLKLDRGEQTLTLRLEPSDENMNGEINKARLEHLRLIKLD